MADQRSKIEHQLRTELTTISIAGQILLREAATAERQQYLANEILSACGRLQHCLDDLYELDHQSPPQ